MYMLGNIVAIIGALWIIVNAFRKDGVLWGIGCFLCGPITLYYAIRNFADNKIPLAMMVIGIVLAVATMPAGTMAGMSAQ
jgi:intracellular septation protein A